MKRKWVGLLFCCLVLCVSQSFAAMSSDFQISVSSEDAKVMIDRVVEEGKLVVSVEDAEKKPLLGLLKENFSLKKQGRQAKVTSVKSFTEEFDVPLNLILVLDNSDSMQKRNAVEPLKEAVIELLKSFRPIDRISIVVFDKNNTMDVGGRPLHVKMLHSSDPTEMQAFLEESYSGKQITYETWLFDALLAGYDLLEKIPEEEQKFMVVFSDGEDNASSVKLEDVEMAAKGLPEFGAYAIDFMPSAELMPAMQGFVAASDGEIWKANDNASLVPIFKEVATDFNRYYVVDYIFPPTGSLVTEPGTLTIEEVKTIDASPMLGHIYFKEGSSDIPVEYVMKESQQLSTFNEQDLEDTLEKYYQVLNVIGKRMVTYPEATIKLVGCNANTGEEKGNRELSMARAAAVQEYLQSAWGIAPERMTLEARNLPEMPSTSRSDEGKADNRRVEIQTESAEILDLVRSTYVAYKADTSMLIVKPVVDSAYGFSNWKIDVANDHGAVFSREGEGAPPTVMVAPLTAKGLDTLAVGGALKASLTAEDKKAQALQLSSSPVQINLIQTSKLMSENQNFLTQEKYALILFAFDSDKIGGQNQTIVAEIVKRIRELPEASVSIVGHTDNLGKEDYNLKLSERRAKAVYDQIIEMYGTEDIERIDYKGVGVEEPLYENVSPETRALNRTVTILLEYEANE